MSWDRVQRAAAAARLLSRPRTPTLPGSKRLPALPAERLLQWPEHEGQRRAELVTHVAEERRPGGIALAQLGIRLRQLLVGGGELLR